MTKRERQAADYAAELRADINAQADEGQIGLGPCGCSMWPFGVLIVAVVGILWNLMQ